MILLRLRKNFLLFLFDTCRPQGELVTKTDYACIMSSHQFFLKMASLKDERNLKLIWILFFVWKKILKSQLLERIVCCHHYHSSRREEDGKKKPPFFVYITQGQLILVWRKKITRTDRSELWCNRNFYWNSLVYG